MWRWARACGLGALKAEGDMAMGSARWGIRRLPLLLPLLKLYDGLLAEVVEVKELCAEPVPTTLLKES